MAVGEETTTARADRTLATVIARVARVAAGAPSGDGPTSPLADTPARSGDGDDAAGNATSAPDKLVGGGTERHPLEFQEAP